MATFVEVRTLQHGDALTHPTGPRQRITRACDSCHQLRTRCDGKLPCSPCAKLSLACTYAREPKKRGQGARKRRNTEQSSPTAERMTGGGREPPAHASDADMDDAEGQAAADYAPNGHAEPLATDAEPPFPGSGRSLPSDDMDAPMSMPIDGGFIPAPHHGFLVSSGQFMGEEGDPSNLERYDSNLGAATSPSQPDYSPDHTFPRFPGPGMLPDVWPRPRLGMVSPGSDPLAWAEKPHYPVLSPLLPHLVNVIPRALATSLLESYFATFTAEINHPLSPYLQTFIFRRASILHPTYPRACSPALLCSMLWLAAQTSEAPALTDSPSSRTRISQKLLELTIELLEPLRHLADVNLVHESTGASYRERISVPRAGQPIRAASEHALSRTSSLDDIITYMHLGTVCSASEHKGSSIRWWSVAWALAREMKLSCEVPRPDIQDTTPISGDLFTTRLPSMQYVSEEEREERRRVWWALYMIDRHLALCYNRALTLSDVECEDLCLPLDERLWQNLQGEELTQCLQDTRRLKGPPTRCFDPTIFGFFLPAMTLLGGIIDLVRLRDHPRFRGCHAQPSIEESLAAELQGQLEGYKASLEALKVHSPEPSHESLQARIAVAYGTHLMHVLHVLLVGRWDPVKLLDDHDLWTNTPDFTRAALDATGAAQAISAILDEDFDLSFMPWFWGIYLLQGSFLVLLVARKLQRQTTTSVLKACQNIVRAHEACVVTLDNEYQRSFRKIMLATIAQIKGQRTEDVSVQQKRQREVLSLYRWTGSGGGLVL